MNYQTIAFLSLCTYYEKLHLVAEFRSRSWIFLLTGVGSDGLYKDGGRSVRKRVEVDFVCNRSSRRYYIQSAFAIPDQEKMEQEQNSLIRIDDSFKKIIVVKDKIKLWRNEKGILIMGVMEFLLNENSLDL